MSDATPIELSDSLFLGGVVDPSSGERSGDLVHLESEISPLMV